MTPVYRTLSFLSNCGFNLGIFGFPAYGYGTVIISPSMDYEMEAAYLPIPRKLVMIL